MVMTREGLTAGGGRVRNITGGLSALRTPLAPGGTDWLGLKPDWLGLKPDPVRF